MAMMGAFILETPDSPLDAVPFANAIMKEFIADDAISALETVFSNGTAPDGSTSTIRKARSDSSAQEATALGIAITAGSIGDTIKVIMFGPLADDFFQYPFSAALFLSQSPGALSDAAPQAGTDNYYVPIAFSMGPGKIFVKPEKPIAL